MKCGIAYALITLGFGAVPASAQLPCEELAGIPMRGMRITSAVTVAATDKSVAYCSVAATVGKELNLEIWMPARWNRKLLGVGNGGLAGSIARQAMVKPLQLGYATSSTDTGHQGGTNDGSWALGHFDRIYNLADGGIHLMAEADKIILKAYYGEQPVHSYFNGCSLGGHEAFVEAQRYPGDFDGIIAGDPANNWTHHYIGGHLYSALATDGEAYIPAGKVHILGDAVNQACDALDGVKDGVLTDPRKCKFDPGVLLCKGSDTSACYTAPQISGIRKIWAGIPGVYPGLVPGGEAGSGGWANWITGKEPGKGGHANLGMPVFKYMLFEDPNWDFHTFKFDASEGFDSDIQYFDSKLGALFNAVDPNLAPFKARGGKMIHYHGWSDPDITPLNSVNYFDSVAKAMGKTDDFYRLFMVPGMQHCSGGPGATSFDMLDSLDAWVTKGTAPEKVIASHLTNGTVDRTRPLCPHPMEAVWNGSGSTDDAASFTCRLPR